MIFEILGGIIIGGALAYIFWDELKEWAMSLFDYLVEEIFASFVVDAITGGLVAFIRFSGGLFRRAKYFKRLYAYFTQGRKEYYLERDVEVYPSDIPSEIRNRLRGDMELPVLRIE